MLPSQIDAVAEEVSTRNRQFEAGLVHALAEVVLAFDPTSAQARREFQLRAQRLEAQYAGQVGPIIQAEVAELIRLATEQTGWEPSEEDAEAIASHFLELTGSMLRDQEFIRAAAIDLVRRHLRNVGLKAVLHSRPGAGLAKLKAEALQDVPFTHRDKQGRQHQSARFVRLTVRGALVLGYADALAFALNRAGKKTVEIVRPSRENERTVLAIAPGADYPMYVERRVELFHPNSTAYIDVRSAR